MAFHVYTLALVCRELKESKPSSNPLEKPKSLGKPKPKPNPSNKTREKEVKN